MRVENVKGAVWTVDEVEYHRRRPQRGAAAAAAAASGYVLSNRGKTFFSVPNNFVLVGVVIMRCVTERDYLCFSNFYLPINKPSFNGVFQCNVFRNDNNDRQKCMLRDLGEVNFQQSFCGSSVRL